MSAGRNVRARRATALALVFALACMAALTAGAAPLYRLFCQVTGYGGTTSTAEAAPGAADGAPLMTVRFNADTARGMPWEFEPRRREIAVRVGEQATVFYEAFNPTGRSVAGVSTYNVTPQKVGEYFAKLDCFCFTEQVLAPGQSVAMPVTFFVDPEIAADPLTSDVRTVTLSYTFFETEGAGSRTAAAPSGDAAAAAY